ncbi:MAG: NAD(P)-dependent oxidoreductase [Cyanobacteria bacterium P01_E01_bin.35]
MAKVAFLGMGAMGSRMAIALLKAGNEVTVWNRSHGKTEALRQAGAKVADTLRTAAQDAEFVISMVRDDQASKQVWLSDGGALASMTKNAIAIESSTLSVAWVKELGQRFKQQSMAFLDAPVAGTLPQADTAQLIYFVGGESATLKQAIPVLQAMGSKIHHLGAVSNGMAIKLAVNSLFAIQVAAWGEIINTIAQSGLEVTQAIDILTSTSICSPAAEIAAKSIADSNFAPLFPIELVTKDLKYALETTPVNQQDLSLIAAAYQIYTNATQQGYGADNITGIAQIYN